ncbi:unnamed protein product, partial [Closterium sp. Naga37s-1]
TGINTIVTHRSTIPSLSPLSSLPSLFPLSSLSSPSSLSFLSSLTSFPSCISVAPFFSSNHSSTSPPSFRCPFSPPSTPAPVTTTTTNARPPSPPSPPPAPPSPPPPPFPPSPPPSPPFPPPSPPSPFLPSSPPLGDMNSPTSPPPSPPRPPSPPAPPPVPPSPPPPPSPSPVLAPPPQNLVPPLPLPPTTALPPSSPPSPSTSAPPPQEPPALLSPPPPPPSPSPSPPQSARPPPIPPSPPPVSPPSPDSPPPPVPSPPARPHPPPANSNDMGNATEPPPPSLPNPPPSLPHSPPPPTPLPPPPPAPAPPLSPSPPPHSPPSPPTPPSVFPPSPPPSPPYTLGPVLPAPVLSPPLPPSPLPSAPPAAPHSSFPFSELPPFSPHFHPPSQPSKTASSPPLSSLPSSSHTLTTPGTTTNQLSCTRIPTNCPPCPDTYVLLPSPTPSSASPAVPPSAPPPCTCGLPMVVVMKLYCGFDSFLLSLPAFTAQTATSLVLRKEQVELYCGFDSFLLNLPAFTAQTATSLVLQKEQVEVWAVNNDPDPAALNVTVCVVTSSPSSPSFSRICNLVTTFMLQVRGREYKCETGKMKGDREGEASFEWRTAVEPIARAGPPPPLLSPSTSPAPLPPSSASSSSPFSPSPPSIPPPPACGGMPYWKAMLMIVLPSLILAIILIYVPSPPSPPSTPLPPPCSPSPLFPACFFPRPTPASAPASALPLHFSCPSTPVLRLLLLPVLPLPSLHSTPSCPRGHALLEGHAHDRSPLLDPRNYRALCGGLVREEETVGESRERGCETATGGFHPSNLIGRGGSSQVFRGCLPGGKLVAVKRFDSPPGAERDFITEARLLSRLNHKNVVKLLGTCDEGGVRCLVFQLAEKGSLREHLHESKVKSELIPTAAGHSSDHTDSNSTADDPNKSLLPSSALASATLPHSTLPSSTLPSSLSVLSPTPALLDWSARLKIALGAAQGLAYLHEDSSPQIIHRDLKTSNILLDADWTARIADLGLARVVREKVGGGGRGAGGRGSGEGEAVEEGEKGEEGEEGEEGSGEVGGGQAGGEGEEGEGRGGEERGLESQHMRGTFGYMAPEYALTGRVATKSDVFSFGVVLLEVLSGRPALVSLEQTQQSPLPDRPALVSLEQSQTVGDAAAAAVEESAAVVNGANGAVGAGVAVAGAAAAEEESAAVLEGAGAAAAGAAGTGGPTLGVSSIVLSLHVHACMPVTFESTPDGSKGESEPSAGPAMGDVVQALRSIAFEHSPMTSATINGRRGAGPPCHHLRALPHDQVRVCVLLFPFLLPLTRTLLAPVPCLTHFLLPFSYFAPPQTAPSPSPIPPLMLLPSHSHSASLHPSGPPLTSPHHLSTTHQPPTSQQPVTALHLSAPLHQLPHRSTPQPIPGEASASSSDLPNLATRSGSAGPGWAWPNAAEVATTDANRQGSGFDPPQEQFPLSTPHSLPRFPPSPSHSPHSSQLSHSLPSPSASPYSTQPYNTAALATASRAASPPASPKASPYASPYATPSAAPSSPSAAPSSPLHLGDLSPQSRGGIPRLLRMSIRGLDYRYSTSLEHSGDMALDASSASLPYSQPPSQASALLYHTLSLFPFSPLPLNPSSLLPCLLLS